MGKANTSIFLSKSDHLGPWPSAGYPGLGRLPMDGLALINRRMAKAYTAVELDWHLFLMAVAAVQPNYAIPIARLPIAGDDGSLGHI